MALEEPANGVGKPLPHDSLIGVEPFPSLDGKGARDRDCRQKTDKRDGKGARTQRGIIAGMQAGRGKAWQGCAHLSDHGDAAVKAVITECETKETSPPILAIPAKT